MHPTALSIQLTNVHKRYGRQYVLRGANLRVSRGEFLSLMGESGSGKSTLLNLVAGIDRPDDGQIFLFDQDITDFTDDELTHLRRRKIGFIFQFFNLLPNLQVFENVSIPLMLRYGITAGPERVRSVLDQVGLADKAHHMIHELSGGEQQRVAIARALVAEPEIIIADEPTGSLDRRTGDRILELIRSQVHAAGRTVLMVTHSERIAATGDRVARIRDGQVQDA